MSALEAGSVPLPRRLQDGLQRIAAVLRADEWGVTEGLGLNPTQLHLLTYLAGRGAAGMRVKAIAAHLGVSQPTATDSIAALERKGLIEKRPDPADARAVAVRATAAGRNLVRLAGRAVTLTGQALAGLNEADQAGLLVLIVKVIRALQQAGAVPVQRSCVGCRYFRANVHRDQARPHHCAFVDAAFGDRDLRLDCAEHAPADEAAERANWAAFAGRPGPELRGRP